VDPVTAEEFKLRAEQTRQLQGFRVGVAVMFGLSIIGLLAPIMLVVSLVFVFVKRGRMKAAGPLFLALGYASVGVSALYSLLMLVFFLTSI
jgi:uncharacterized membrane protein